MNEFNFDKIVSLIEPEKHGYVEKTIPCLDGMIKMFYINQLTDRIELTDNVIRPIIEHCSSLKNSINAKMAIDGIIYADDCKIETDADEIENFILSGMVVILFSNDNQYIVANFKKVEHRSIPTPQLAYSVRGPQDCFTENLDVNISLIRYRVKDRNMRLKFFEIGLRTKTRVCVIYIEDIANNVVVNEIQKRIEEIDIDGIGESGELQAFLLNNEYQIFPQMGLIERSDMAFHCLIDGKVIVVVDGSGVALVAPKTFAEFFFASDDRYDNKFFSLFSKLIRYFAIIIVFTGSSTFVALTSFHTDVLPSQYAISLAEMRSNVPFSAFVGAVILEFIVELLREALLRVPKQIGPAIGIVGAIVIGQAAISAGIFSPLLLIIVCTSLLASFVMPDYSLVNTFRILKFVLLIFTGLLGFFGFSLVITFVLAELVSLNSFGVPYMAPFAPFHFKDFLKTFMFSTTTSPKRFNYLKNKDSTRTKKP